ncbi:MAG: hypothetical protein ACNS63_04230 [Candidatus Nitrospinota bacterium M3_3B_026]
MRNDDRETKVKDQTGEPANGSSPRAGMSLAAGSPELDEHSYLLALLAVQLDVLAVEAPEAAAEFLSARLGREVEPEEMEDMDGLFYELVLSSHESPYSLRSWLRRTLMENALEDHALGRTPLMRRARGYLGLEPRVKRTVAPRSLARSLEERRAGKEER